MSYAGEDPRILSKGCLPATIFGLVVGAPVLTVTLIGHCYDDSGNTIPCPATDLLIVVAVMAGLCGLIMWVTNRFVLAMARRGVTSAWPVLAICLFVSVLSLTILVVLF